MKTIFAILALVLMNACATAPEKKFAWTIDPNDKPAVTKFVADYRECQDFAYKSTVRGSRYTESDILYSCVERKGYQWKMLDAEKVAYVK